MINILSYVGMNIQAEVCLWTLLGLVRTIFDATLFKVNANLKQVWQMTMPAELSRPVQRVLRTMISGIMLVECFTVYVYLASYIVLLYPVFLEERPTLVLPWLLLAAIRKLLCELTSLTLGLGTCLLVGPARSACIKFVMLKVVSITPAFYTWMLVFSYYNTLKVTSAFKILRNGSISSNPDYGLELAVRRRRTKSLLDEDQLRSNLVASLYGEKNLSSNEGTSAIRAGTEISTRMAHSTDTNSDDMKADAEILKPLSVTSNKMLEIGSCEDWFGTDHNIIPRDTDRILEQFALMMLRISIYLTREGTVPPVTDMLTSHSTTNMIELEHFHGTSSMQDDGLTPPIIASSSTYPPTYLREFPQIFMKNTSELQMPTITNAVIQNSQQEDNNMDKNIKNRKRSVTIDSNGMSSLTIEKEIQERIIPARKSSLVNNVEDFNPNEAKKEDVTDKENRSVKQYSCSCLKLHSTSSASVDSIIQVMKSRLSESKHCFREYKKK